MINPANALIDSRLKWIFLLDFISGIFMVAAGFLFFAAFRSFMNLFSISCLVLLLFIWTHSRFGAWRIISKTKFSLKRYLDCIALGLIFGLAYLSILYWAVIFIFQKYLYIFIGTLNLISSLEINAIVFIWLFIFGIPLFLFMNLPNLFFSAFASPRTIKQAFFLIIRKPKTILFHALCASASFSVIFLISSLLMRLKVGYIIAYFIYVLFFSWYKLSAQKVIFENG
jgi:hypothetical protein